MLKILLIMFSVFIISIRSDEMLAKNVIFPTLPTTLSHTGNGRCDQENQQYREHLKNFTLWAYEMQDSNANPPAAILRGNAFDFGSYDQCISAKAPFQTQYCLPTIIANIPENYKNKDPLAINHDPYESILNRLYQYDDMSQETRNVISMGWCLPASCSPEMLKSYLTDYIKDINLPLKKYGVNYSVHLTSLQCQVEEKYENVTRSELIFFVLTGIIFFIIIIASIYDFNDYSDSSTKYTKKSLFQILQISFSIKRNVLDLNKPDESNEALRVLYGMRTYAALLVVIMHRLSYMVVNPAINNDYIESFIRSPATILFARSDLPVDMFYVLGGLLVTYSLLIQLDKAPINPLFTIVLRYIRLTPLYAFIIFFYSTVIHYIGSGPIWKMSIEQEIIDCKNNWWANLLYINNYYDFEHMCIGQAWYLPTSLHYFILEVALCLLIKKNKNLGFLVLAILTVVSMIIPFAVTIANHSSVLVMIYPKLLRMHKMDPELHDTYIKTHTRATTYLIGVYAGYLYYKLKNKDHIINKTRTNIIFAISTLTVIGVILSGTIYYDPYRKYNAWEVALYVSISRPIFALALVGILYVASYGKHRFLYTLFSWSPLIPLSKLVYGVYLIHVVVQIKHAGEITAPPKFSFFDLTYQSFADIIFSFIFAFILYISVEAPCKNICGEILMSRSERKVANKKE